MSSRRTLAVRSPLVLSATGLSLSLALGAARQPGPAANAAAPAPVWAQEDAPGPGVATSETCTLCHSESVNAAAMRDRKGNSIAPFDLWRSTMMANSARDPFWRAVMSAEMAATPNAKNAIAAKCLKCHTPLADQIGLDDHGTDDPLHALDCDGNLGDMARDGVSCTICHGISPEGLGTDASFTAGFKINPNLELYGPHKDPVPGPMRVHSGFTPTYSDHLTRSSLCGSCHTLQTDALSPEGEVVGTGFHEQTPYLEWRNSAFADEDAEGAPMEPAPGGSRTCQSCHVPTTDEAGMRTRTKIARNPPGFDFPFIEPRSPFGRHLFVGGNAFMLTMLRDNAEALGVQAPAEAFDRTIAATRDQLSSRTASVSIENAKVEGDLLRLDVDVRNLTGHKLPTGHPSRRMWLEVVAKGEGGEVLFASGSWNDQGLIVDQAGEVLPTEARGGPIEPHRELVTSGDEVARYRAVMADVDGDATYLLLRGDSWFVDDRILPRGWDPAHDDALATLPYGTGKDADYAPKDGAKADGKDRVSYRIALGGKALDSVSVRLVYQTVSPRYVAESLVFETPEIDRFMGMYEASDRTPEVLASGYWRPR